MVKQALLPVVAIGLMVGWFAPSFQSAETGGAKVHEFAKLERPKSGAPDQPATWYGGEVVLPRDADGHFYATVSAEMRDYRMLVDTGASVVALTGDDALDMGLDWDPQAVSVIGRGASGDVHGVAVTIPQLRIGEFEAQNIDAVIVPEGLDVSLLGQSFLGRLSNVKISGDRMVLGN